MPPPRTHDTATPEPAHPAPARGDRPPRPPLERGWVQLCLGLLLTATAGWVDAVGYLRLKGLYLSFMSGNSLEMSVAAAGGDWSPATASGLLIACLFAGALLGTVAAGLSGAWSLPVTLALETALLGAALGISLAGWRSPEALAPVVLAMGVQNIALPPWGSARLGATFITGTLVSVGQELGRALLGRSDRWAWIRPALVWAALVGGAAAGATWVARVSRDALLPPVALVAMLAVACAVATLIQRPGPVSGTEPGPT